MSTTSEAYDRGARHGWDSANYAQAYGADAESLRAESIRRAGELYPETDQWRDDARAYARGFVMGWIRYANGEYADGTSMAEPSETRASGSTTRED